MLDCAGLADCAGEKMSDLNESDQIYLLVLDRWSVIDWSAEDAKLGLL